MTPPGKSPERETGIEPRIFSAPRAGAIPIGGKLEVNALQLGQGGGGENGGVPYLMACFGWN